MDLWSNDLDSSAEATELSSFHRTRNVNHMRVMSNTHIRIPSTSETQHSYLRDLILDTGSIGVWLAGLAQVTQADEKLQALE